MIKKFLFLTISCFFVFSFGIASDTQHSPAPYWIGPQWQWEAQWQWKECEWVKLNTNVPFIGDWKDGRCIKKDNVSNAFPSVMWGLSKMIISLILVISFIMLIAGWVMISMSWADQNMKSKGKTLIIRVIVWIVLLWASWVILHIINPNFFK